MQEDLQKKFILLSKVAKEKKYAQEYMGLLARRGDIGSIRIGKRWYTTWAWFEEFLENGQKQKKKEIVSEVQAVPAVPVKIEKIEPAKYTEKKTAFAEAIAGDVKINVPVAVKTKRFEMPVRKNISEDIREIKIQPKITQARNFHQERNSRFFPQMEAKFENIYVEEKNRRAIPYPEIKFKKNTSVFSPDFSGEKKMSASLFPKFVFAAGFAMMFFLVAASGYFVFSDGIFKKGTVAGASNERNGAFSGINSGGEYFLANAGDKIKESLSVSRVAVEAAKERGNQGN